jgi:hypothetical protein
VALERLLRELGEDLLTLLTAALALTLAASAVAESAVGNLLFRGLGDGAGSRSFGNLETLHGLGHGDASGTTLSRLRIASNNAFLLRVENLHRVDVDRHHELILVVVSHFVDGLLTLSFFFL